MRQRTILDGTKGAKDKELGREGKAKKLNKVQIRKDIRSKDLDFTALAEAQSATIIPKLQDTRKEGISN